MEERLDKKDRLKFGTTFSGDEQKPKEEECLLLVAISTDSLEQNKD